MKTHFHKRKDKNLFYKAAIIVIFVVMALFLYINQFQINMRACGFADFEVGTLRVFNFDVGQASSSLLVLPDDTTILIDAGTDESEASLVKEIDWILNNAKRKAIDFFILTHPDADHVGGADAIFETFQVFNVFRPKLVARGEKNEFGFDCVYTNAYLDAVNAMKAEPRCEISFTENKTMVFGDTVVEIYACEKETYSQTNSFSPFVHVEYAGRSFLFTGDATEEREKELLTRLESEGKQWEIDFLMVAHHGSRYSSSVEFLQALKPRYAFISAGDSTHPSQHVLKRLQDCKVKRVFVTKQVGTNAIFVAKDGKFEFRTSQNSLDLPLIVVVLVCGGFVFVQLIDLRQRAVVRGFSAKKNAQL